MLVSYFRSLTWEVCLQQLDGLNIGSRANSRPFWEIDLIRLVSKRSQNRIEILHTRVLDDDLALPFFVIDGDLET